MGKLTNRPATHHSVNPFVVVRGAADFIDFTTAVFGATETTVVRTPDRDGTLIHAEVVIGDSTIMIGDTKPDWPFTPALLQVYVEDAEEVLARATAHGGTVVTPVSSFYGGFDLARVLDPWHNLWWLYTPSGPEAATPEDRTASTDWHDEQPRAVYTTLMETMRTLAAP